MANSLTTNPIVIDTFAIDIGDALYNDFKTTFFLNSIEWQNPTSVGDTAIVTDANDNPIFSATCTVAKQSVIKYFFNQPVRGIKVSNGSDDTILCQDGHFLLTQDRQSIFIRDVVGSGKIVISLR